MRLPDAPLWCRGCLGSSRRWHLAAPRLHNALSPHLHTCTPPHYQAREVQAMVVLQRKRQLRRDALQVWDGGGGGHAPRFGSSRFGRGQEVGERGAHAVE